MKKKLITSLSVLLVLGIITGCGCKKKENTKDNTNNQPRISENTNKGIVEDKTVDGIKMTKTSMITNNGETVITTKVVNNTGKDYTLKGYNIIIKDKDGNVIKTLPGYFGSIIKNGETKELKNSTNADLSEAVLIEYEVKK